MRKDSDNVNVLSLLLQSPRLSSLFFGMKSQHSTDSMFYSKQPLPRVFCALPPVSPTWCAKTVENSMYCLYCFNHLDSLRCFLHEKSTFNWLYVLLQAASSSRLLCSSSSFAYMVCQDCWKFDVLSLLLQSPRLSSLFFAWKVNIQLTLCSTPSSLFLASSVLFLQFCLVVCQDCCNLDVLSLLIQPPRLSSMFFGMKSQHSTDSMFYSKQPLPRVFCALPPIVPTSCERTLTMWMYCLYWFNHPDSIRCFLAWKVNIQLTLCFTPSSLFLASSVLFLQSCLHHAKGLWQCGCIVFIDSTTQIDVFWHEKSTFNWFYVLLQAASSSRLLCSSSNRAYIMRQDSGNVDVLSLLIQPSRLFSLLFGMKSQHSTDSMFYSKQPLPRVFCALPPIVPTSYVKTLAIWMYCLYCFNHPDSLRCFLAWKVNIQLTLCSTPSSLFLASSVLFLQSCLHHASRLWQCGCIVFIGTPPRLSSLFFGMKSQHSTDSMFYSSSLFLASSVLFLQSCLHHAKGLWQCGCIVWIDSTTQTLFAVIWHEKSTFNWFYVLLQAASSSRLLCSSSNRAYIMRKDSGNVDVLSLLIQPPRLYSLLFGMKSQHSTDSMFYSKQPLPRVFCALPPIAPTSCVKTLTMWICLHWFNHPNSLRCYLAWKVNIQHDSMFYSKQPLPRVFCALPPIVPTSYVKTLAMWMYCLCWFNHPDSLRCCLAWKVNIQHDSMFYSQQPLPRVFCALPPIVPTSCVKTLAMWMYCLYWFNQPDYVRCFLAWKVNIQLTLCSTPSSLYLASSVLFLQFCLVVRQDCCNLDVLSLLIQPPRLFSLFFGMKGQHSTDSMFYSKQPLPRVFCALPPIVPTSCVKTLAMWMYCLYWFNHPDFLRCFLAWKVNIQLTLCSTPSSLFLASSVLFLQSCLHHASRLWQCGCIVCVDSITQTLFAVFWHEKSTFNWLYVLL